MQLWKPQNRTVKNLSLFHKVVIFLPSWENIHLGTKGFYTEEGYDNKFQSQSNVASSVSKTKHIFSFRT